MSDEDDDLLQHAAIDGRTSVRDTVEAVLAELGEDLVAPIDCDVDPDLPFLVAGHVRAWTDGHVLFKSMDPRPEPYSPADAGRHDDFLEPHLRAVPRNPPHDDGNNGPAAAP